MPSRQRHSIDGFSFRTATRGSGTGVQIGAAWKTYRGVRPILPKVFVQARVDGGTWGKLKKGPRRARRSVASDTLTVRYDNDAASLAASTAEPEVSKLGIAIHECAHMKQSWADGRGRITDVNILMGSP